MLSDGLWQRRFGGDPAVIGRALVVDGEPHTIIGVIRAGFDPAFTRTEFWTPLNLRAVERQGATFVQGIGGPAARCHRGAGGERDGGAVSARSRTRCRRSSNGAGATACSTCVKRATARKATPC